MLSDVDEFIKANSTAFIYFSSVAGGPLHRVEIDDNLVIIIKCYYCASCRWQEPLWQQQWRLQPPMSPQQQDVHVRLSNRLQEGRPPHLC